MPGEGTLDIDGALEGAADALEGQHEPVTLRLHLEALAGCHLLPDDGVVAAEQLQPAPVAQALGHLGGALDVGEEDGDGAVGGGVLAQVGLVDVDGRGDGVDGRFGDGGVDALGLELEGQSLLDQGLHPQLLGGVQCLAKQVQRLLAVAGLAAGQEHFGVIVLSMGDRGPGPHPGVHLQGVLEMLLRFLPAPHGGG